MQSVIQEALSNQGWHYFRKIQIRSKLINVPHLDSYTDDFRVRIDNQYAFPVVRSTMCNVFVVRMKFVEWLLIRVSSKISLTTHLVTLPCPIYVISYFTLWRHSLPKVVSLNHRWNSQCWIEYLQDWFTVYSQCSPRYHKTVCSISGHSLPWLV